MLLTDTRIRNAKPGPKPYKIFDGGSLYLLVKPNGSKLWRMAYRYAGKQKTLVIGVYPFVTLAEAREARMAAKKLLAAGDDPVVAKQIAKRQKLIAAANTFDVVADEWLEKLKREKRADATIAKAKWLLTLAKPKLGHRPISEITSAEVLDVLRRIEIDGRLETAKRLRSTIGRVFRYAIATSRAENDPTVALRGAIAAPKVKHRAAITDPKAFGALLRSIDAFEGQPATRAALQLMALLFPRPGELRASEWLEFDLEAAVWTIPAERTKMRREHRVPLAAQALEILQHLKETNRKSDFVFPSYVTARRPISENTVNIALRRLGYSQEEMTAHGFRATATTLLDEAGQWRREVVERQMAHVERDGVRRAYARSELWAERVKMMAWWADYLDNLRAVGQVIPVTGRQGIVLVPMQ